MFPDRPPEFDVQEKPSRSFRTILAQVMAVQLVSLAFLWWLQTRYGR